MKYICNIYCNGSLTCLPGLDLASSLLIRCNTVSVTYQLCIHIYRTVTIPSIQQWTQRLPFVSSTYPWVDHGVTDALSSSDLDGDVSTTRSWADPSWPWLRAIPTGSFCMAKSAIKHITAYEKDNRRRGIGKRSERYDNVSNVHIYTNFLTRPRHNVRFHIPHDR